MKRSVAFCLIFIWGVMPALSSSNFESVRPGNWAKVESLSQGLEISVKMAFGDKMVGEYMGLDEEALRLFIDGKERSYPRKDVAEIRLLEVRDSNSNGTLIGLAIGAGAGAGLCAGGCEAWHYAFAISLFGGIGALIGYMSDSLHKGNELIYRAPPNS
jgi:hypothetical protein